MDAARPDNLQQESDTELVRLLVAGNHDAMTVIFDRYYRLVMSVALRMLHDAAEATFTTKSRWMKWTPTLRPQPTFIRSAWIRAMPRDWWSRFSRGSMRSSDLLLKEFSSKA